MAPAPEQAPPIPLNEAERIKTLSDFDFDFNNFQINFDNITALAAKISGTNISLVNLIDSFTQWSVSNYGLEIEQMPREESICQYTIAQDGHFEISDMSVDERAKNFFYVRNPLNLRYYFGIPLKTPEGYNIGALCVLDQDVKKLSPEKIELLKLLAIEVVDKFVNLKVLDNTRLSLDDLNIRQHKLAHDIRGPLSGIKGIIEIIRARGYKNKMFDVMDYLFMIDKSNNEVLELTDEILVQEKKIIKDEFNLNIFKDKLEKLYAPQAKSKNIFFKVSIVATNNETNFPKAKLLHISGNLISNAIKFSSDYGTVTVKLGLDIKEQDKNLRISVSDNGNGLSQAKIDQVMNGDLESSDGTQGERGYGFGLPMVLRDIKSLNGSMEITSEEGWGTNFEVKIPF